MKNFVFIVMFFLASCAQIESEYSLDASKPISEIPANYGIIIGSMTSNDHDKHEYSRGFKYRSLDNKKIDSIVSIYLAFSIPEIEDEVFALLLPQGSYEFNSFYMMGVGAVGDTLTWEPEQDFSIPFNVIAGKAIYIGDIENIPTKGENMFGFTIPTGGYFVISDQSARDLPFLQKKYEILNKVEVLNGTLAQGNVSPELIRFK